MPRRSPFSNSGSSARMPIVFVISKDWTLRALVRAELRHAGIEALGMESVDDAGRAIAEGHAPSAIVLDAAQEPDASMERQALRNLAGRVPVVLVASRVERAVPLEGAAALVYRPVRVIEIVARVKELLGGQAA